MKSQVEMFHKCRRPETIGYVATSTVESSRDSIREEFRCLAEHNTLPIKRLPMLIRILSLNKLLILAVNVQFWL